VPLFARRRWPLVEGRVIDKRHLKKYLARYDATSVMVSVDEYLVEFPRPDGGTGRTTIKGQSVRLPLRGVHVGQTVPLHVNKRGTKAVFGRFEPVVSWSERRRRDKARRANDEARFAEKLRERR
jgi:hypothetical protein